MSTVRQNLKVINVNPECICRDEVGQVINHDSFGEAVSSIAEDADGRMFIIAHDEELTTQVNYDPFTGAPARTPIQR